MADFLPAYAVLLKLEGGYNKIVGDHGGETYKGISRNNWPGWDGWPQVDRLKFQKDFPLCLDHNVELQGKVRDFYQRNFWTPTLDRIKDQQLATWLFEKGVNMGIRQAVRLLQRALHVDDDGIIGPQTMAALNAADSRNLLNAAREEAKRYYTKLALNDPTQHKFLHGWLARA
jgi:lysozyme family protein